jgi:hypothetical protein
MPVLWGHSKSEEAMNDGGIIEQYTKWFEIMNMDFSLHYSVAGWKCVARIRDIDVEEYVTYLFPTIEEALHSIYALVMKDIRNPF